MDRKPFTDTWFCVNAEKTLCYINNNRNEFYDKYDICIIVYNINTWIGCYLVACYNDSILNNTKNNCVWIWRSEK